METKEYLQMMREMKDFTFATLDEDGRPATRIIDVMLVDDDRLYFLTARGKEFYRQLMDQQFVSMTGMTKNWEMLTLSGRVKRVSQEMLTPVFEANPSMNDVYPGDSRGILEVFCLYEGQGEYFNLSKTPIYRETFFLGNPVEHKKGYEITDICISCGICAGLCPQKCIGEGEPYIIRQENCLHCGLCAENCPTEAIRRR
ncbi:4Fe-4S binding protein [Christensenella intestinihominis]|uniref:4Fe-4S binding protein n=1 Tax=Christensenella intestinihominis TaxID=1851429 RepID=UPI00082FD767|nr:4Fe-4S binding protein [Christensenella intestinihominis]